MTMKLEKCKMYIFYYESYQGLFQYYVIQYYTNLLGILKGADSKGSFEFSEHVMTKLSRLFTPPILLLLPFLILSNSAPKM